MSKIALIGSLYYPRLMGQAIVNNVQDGDLYRVPMPDSPTNAMIGDWHHWIGWADEVVVVSKPDVSLGAGTVAELKEATRPRIGWVGGQCRECGRKAVRWDR